MFMNLSRGFIYTMFSALVWAVVIILTRLALLQGEYVYTIIFWSTLIAAPYWIYVARAHSKEVRTLSKRDYSILLGMGAVSGIGVVVIEIFALQYSTATNYAFLIRTVIVFTILFAYFFLGEAITKKKIILTIVLLFGAYLLTTKGARLTFSLGDMLTLLQAACIAFGNNILGKLATNRISTDTSAAGVFLISAIPLCILSFFMGGVRVPVNVFLLIALTIASIVLIRFRFRAYKHASASYVTMIFSFTPVFVMIMAILFLGERMNSLQFVGGVLIVLAGIGVEKLNM
jgi:drug/metabolite transporter (DMT)-like permease